MTKETKKTPVAGTAAGVTSTEDTKTTTETTQDPNLELEQLRAENSALKEKVEALESELDKVKKHYEDLGTQNTNLQENVTGLNEAIERYEELAKTLRGYIEEKDNLIAELQVEQVDPDKLIYTSASGDKFEVTQSEFRFMGTLYQAADAIENHTEVMESLVESKSFILKQA